MNKPLISLLIPVFNEQDNVEWHHQKVSSFLTEQKITHEIIYINDGSLDKSLEMIKKIAKSDASVRYLSFSRNFGKEAATSAGLRACKGSAAVMMDADGQHPVELIAGFIDKWKQGAKVVVGVRKANKNEGFVKKYGSRFFYMILNGIAGGNTKPGSTDFRLIDRQVIEHFNSLTERNRITRGLIDWLGFRQDYVYFVAHARHSGKAGYSLKKLNKLALHALVSQTTKPLQITGFLGGLVMLVSSCVGIFLAIETYVLNDPLNLAVTGTAILALFLSFLLGIVMICQWLLALYVESIHNETQNRPLYVIEEES